MQRRPRSPSNALSRLGAVTVVFLAAAPASAQSSPPASPDPFVAFVKAYDWKTGVEAMRNLILAQQPLRPPGDRLTKEQLAPRKFKAVFASDFDGSAGNTTNLPVTVVAREDIVGPDGILPKNSAFRNRDGHALIVHGVTSDDLNRDLAELQGDPLLSHLPWTAPNSTRSLVSTDFSKYDSPDHVLKTRLYPGFVSRARAAARGGALNIVNTGRTKIDLKSAFHRKFNESGVPLAAVITVGDPAVQAALGIDPKLPSAQKKQVVNMLLTRLIEPEAFAFGDDSRDIVTEFIRRMAGWAPATRFAAYDVNHVVDKGGRVRAPKWELIATSTARGEFVDAEGSVWDDAKLTAHDARPQPRLPRLTRARVRGWETLKPPSRQASVGAGRGARAGSRR